MHDINIIPLFEEFTVTEKEVYEQEKIKNDKEMFKYLKQFIILEEKLATPYKYRAGYYNKKAHYINGKKVNRQIFNYVKRWLDTI